MALEKFQSHGFVSLLAGPAEWNIAAAAETRTSNFSETVFAKQIPSSL